MTPQHGPAKSEGYWRRTSLEDESGLPFPVSESKPWKGRDTFLAALARKEEMAEEVVYRGWSSCRLCNSANGHSEYWLDPWKWPEGLRHYVELHNVRPTDEFVSFILDE
jgi:hypothetical protein